MKHPCILEIKTNDDLPLSIEEEKDRSKMEGYVPLTEKRFLNIKEFQQYTSLGKNRAADLARASGCIFRFGRRKMIDRKKFDAWCDAQ